MSSFERLRHPRVLQGALIVLAVAYVIAHIAAVFTESFNWDEFALLARAEAAVRTGVLSGGGRPGLGVLILVPFVDGCSSTTDVLHAARLLWLAFTFALLAGVFVLLRRVARGSDSAWYAAALGTAAFALIPVVMRWSLQVRTDHPAVVLAVWGGVALLASRTRPAWSVVAGLLIGGGYLFSQKAIYVVALVMVLAAGEVFVERKLVWRRDAIRMVGVAVGAVAVIVVYRWLLSRAYTPTQSVSVEGGLELFRWYRLIVGYRVYQGMLPTLWPHIVMLGLLTYALARASRHKSIHLRPLGVAMVVVLLGVAVGAFHAAAFPYFWITLGLFPAAALAIGWPGIRAALPRAAPIVTGGVWLWWLAIAIPYRAETLEDTQQIQRESFAFVQTLPRGLHGIQLDGALVCRGETAPLPVLLRENMMRRFGGPNGDRNAQAFLEQVQSLPVAYLVRTHRFQAFPEPLRSYWATNYVPYSGAVELAGRRIAGAATQVLSLELFVPGTYRWIAEGSGPARIQIGGRTYDRGALIELSTGPAQLELLDAVKGVIVLAVDRPPAVSPEPFYDDRPIAEIVGRRRRW